MPKLIPIHYRRLAKVFEKEGWVLVGQTGDYLQFKKEGQKEEWLSLAPRMCLFLLSKIIYGQPELIERDILNS